MPITKILLVDDDDSVRETIDNYLSEFGYDVDYAIDCKSAVEKLKCVPYSVILIDLNMKDFAGNINKDAGIELLKFIKKENYDIPAIILTSYPDIPSIRKAMLTGAADYVQKTPEEMEKLSDLIEKKINRNKNLMIQLIRSSRQLDDIKTDIFQKLFSTYDKIIVHEFAKGSRGAILYRINFQDRDGGWNVPLIVKIGWRDEILAEISAFKKYVRHKIPESRCPEIYGSAFSGKYGGITYSFIGASDFSKIKTFKEYINFSSIEDIEMTIESIFEKSFRIWHENKGNKTPLNLFDEYIDVLFSDEKLEKAIKTYLPEYYSQDIITFNDNNISFQNPLNLFKNIKRTYEISTYVCITHGDLNTKNIIIDDENNVWLIDFERAGRAHIMSDYAELETSIKYTSIKYSNLNDLYILEDVLLNQTDFKQKIKFKSDNDEINKVFYAVKKIREMAFFVVRPSNDITEYLISLLFYTLNMLRFSNKDIPKEMKRVILFSASKLISNINKVI